MSYYNPNAYGFDASLTENVQPVNVPAVNRYLSPKGLDYNASAITGNLGIHSRAAHIEYIPLVVDTAITIDRIGLGYLTNNSTASTWYYDLGLYEGSVAEEYPATKLADFGTITIAPATATGAQLITINQTLDANKLYFLAMGIRWSDNADFLSGKTPFLVQQHGNFSMFAKRGLSSAVSAGFGMAWMEQLQTYTGTLPSTTSYANNSAVAPLSPRLVLRRSA